MFNPSNIGRWLACTLACLALWGGLPATGLADVFLEGEGFVVVLARGGEPVHLEGGLVEVVVSLAGAPPGALEAVERAFGSWEKALAACGSALRFRVSATGEEGRLCQRDGRNFVFWGECRDVARTRTYSRPERPATIHGFDIILNRAKPWGVAEDGRVGFDPESVLAHEIGHVLGLADVLRPAPQEPGESSNRELTMYGWGACGETLKRELKAGERRAVEFLYGRPGGPASPPALAERALLDSAPACP